MSGPRPPIFSRGLALAIFGALLCSQCSLVAQTPNTKAQAEQSGFGIELEAEPVLRPAELPRAALGALSEDKRVAFCLKKNGIDGKELSSRWFIASEIHLDGPEEADFVVLPSGRLPDTPAAEISQNACLVGANTAQMWVLRKTQAGFEVVLSQIGLGMNVLSTRTNGLRDIRVGAVVGMAYACAIEYKFDGKAYQVSRRTSQMTGAEVPASLSGYETRNPLVQSRGETPELVRAEARAWIWERWRTHRLSYLRTQTHDDDADETTTYYIAPNEKRGWEVTIEKHRILQPTTAQGSITEDDLAIATDVERTEPGAEDAWRSPVFPGTENLPASKYRLRFRDYAERIIGTL